MTGDEVTTTRIPHHVEHSTGAEGKQGRRGNFRRRQRKNTRGSLMSYTSAKRILNDLPLMSWKRDRPAMSRPERSWLAEIRNLLGRNHVHA